MNQASGEEAVGAVFTNGRAKGKAKWEDQDEGPSSGQDKRKKKDRSRPNHNTVAAPDCAGKRQGNTDHFEQLLEMCTNHGYLVKHKLKDWELLKHMLGQPSWRKGGDRNKEVPRNQGAPAKCHILKYLILGCEYLLERVHLSIGFPEKFPNFFKQLFSFILELGPYFFGRL
jgi:hypothetical protein